MYVKVEDQVNFVFKCYWHGDRFEYSLSSLEWYQGDVVLLIHHFILGNKLQSDNLQALEETVNLF